MTGKFLVRGEHTQLVITQGIDDPLLISASLGEDDAHAGWTVQTNVAMELSLAECLNLRDFFVNTYGLSDDNIKASKLYQDAVTLRDQYHEGLGDVKRELASLKESVTTPAPVPTIETVHLLREQHREIARMIADLSTILETTL